MTVNQIKEFLRQKPGYLKRGAGSLAVLLEADIHKCRKALKQVRKELSFPKEKTQSDNLVLKSRWYNGKEWCESFQNVHTDPEPITKEDWVEIIKEIGPLQTLTVTEEPIVNKRTLIVWTSDKHIGASIPSDSLYKRQYNQHVFHNRMGQVFDNIVSYYKIYGKFDELIIADLGDSLDGYNKQTVRGGHALPQNLNNKEAARVHFYTHKWLLESIIELNMSNKLTVLNITNDNHAGDFGWHACFGLEQYASVAWPNVNFINVEEFLGHYIVYDKAFIITHGKDKKNRTRGLPANVNAEVESFIMDYAIDRKISNLDIHLRKGDLHMNILDCSRNKMTYFNIGSVFGASDWIMDNFSDGKPSCVFEIVEENNANINTSVLLLQ